MKSRKIVTWLVLCVVAYFLAAVWLVSPPTQSTDSAGSSFSTAQTGTQALFTLLSTAPAKGAQQEAYEPQTGMIDSPELILIEPSQDDTLQTAKNWITLARQGHTIVELSDTQTPLMTMLGVRLERERSRRSATFMIRETVTPTVAPQFAQPLIGSWAVSTQPHPLRLITGVQTSDRRYNIQLSTDHQGVIGFTRKLGAGHITILTLPSIAYNGWIAKADNLPLLLHILQPTQESIGFVETIHGHSAVPGSLAVLGAGANAAFAFLCAAILLLLWSESVRFGAPKRATRPQFEAAHHLFVQAVADQYKKAHDLAPLLNELAQLSKHKRGFVPHFTPRQERSHKAFIIAINAWIRQWNDQTKKE